MNDNRTSPYVPFKHKLRAIEFLKYTPCSLNKEQQNKVLQSAEKEICKALLCIAKHSSLTEAGRQKKHTNYSWFQTSKNYKQWYY